mmetsp:Transcript_68289/g.203163  ORF Transcript_68289/g.203163 Transcript_68289/m.203163 type:complete len:184 (-) Transcript_68289:288-839(-)
MVAALLIGAIIHAVAASDPQAGVIPLGGKHRLGGVSSTWHDGLLGVTLSGLLERAAANGTVGLHARSRGTWCGPAICFVESGAKCFERHSAQFCVRIVYICVKYILEGCQLKPHEQWPPDQEISLPAEAEDDGTWHAVSWSLAAAAAAAAVSSVMVPAMRRPRARNVDPSPLLARPAAGHRDP